MKIAHLPALRELIQISYATATVSVWIIFCIPGDFVNKIAQVQHKRKLLMPGTGLIFKDHSPVGIQGGFVRTLATHKGKTNRCVRIVAGCSHCTANSAGETMLIYETVPIFAVGFEICGQKTTCPICISADMSDTACQDFFEFRGR